MITDTELIELETLVRDREICQGISDFWRFCQLKSPKYYTERKPHLKTLCTVLQNFYEGKLIREDGLPFKKLMINMPPRMGKTRTMTNFSQWILGKNQNERIILGSYNDDTAGDFSKYTRDGIQEERHTEDSYVFSDFFPVVKIRFGTSSYSKWALEGQHFNYIGAGIGGSLTGKGGSIQMIDDPVKNDSEAFNEERLEKIWSWYVGTFLSRGDTEEKNDSEIAEDPLEIVTMTRWSSGDICGRILASEDSKNWYKVIMKAYDETTDTMLCERTLSRTRYLDLMSKMTPEIFYANYLQETIEARGLLYKSLKTYDSLPVDENKKTLIEGIYNYTDTADEGSDYLCSINYAVYRGEAYILDVLYTKEGMELTESKAAKMMFSGKVNQSKIESNNGGRGFARNVERILKEVYKSNSTVIKWFHQSDNKDSRILTQSSFVQEHIYFPLNWKDRWPGFFKSMTTYIKEGKNRNDDAQDCITGIAEQLSKRSSIGFLKEAA